MAFDEILFRRILADVGTGSACLTKEACVSLIYFGSLQHWQAEHFFFFFVSTWRRLRNGAVLCASLAAMMELSVEGPTSSLAPLDKPPPCPARLRSRHAAANSACRGSRENLLTSRGAACCDDVIHPTRLLFSGHPEHQ